MPVITRRLEFSTNGNGEVIDITEQVADIVLKSGLTSGIVTVFVPGSTAGLTTIEYEEGLLHDLQKTLDKIIPDKEKYAHDERWRDGNGYAHIRSSFLGTSLTVPFTNKRLLLGTWQQIIFIDFDNRSRSRKVICQLLGE